MPSTQTLRIVIADDEIDIREYFEALLPRLGHQLVGQAANGKQLIELCAAESPDLIITDIMMPELDGLEAAKQIAETQSVPIIVMSSHERPVENVSPWIVDYLVKPVTIADLKTAIEKACDLS